MKYRYWTWIGKPMFIVSRTTYLLRDSWHTLSPAELQRPFLHSLNGCYGLYPDVTQFWKATESRGAIADLLGGGGVWSEEEGYWVHDLEVSVSLAPPFSCCFLAAMTRAFLPPDLLCTLFDVQLAGYGLISLQTMSKNNPLLF